MRHCPTNFENDAAKTGPAGHLAHTDFGLAQDFESVSYMEYSHAKNNLGLHRNSRSCNRCFDWCIGFMNCTGTSVQRQYVSIIIMKMANSRHSDGPMKTFLTCAAHSRCPTARNRKQQNYLRILAVQLAEKKCQDSQASETDAYLPAVTVRLCQS